MQFYMVIVKVRVKVIVFFVTLGYYIDVSGIFFPIAFAFSFQIFGISVCLYYLCSAQICRQEASCERLMTGAITQADEAT